MLQQTPLTEADKNEKPTPKLDFFFPIQAKLTKPNQGIWGQLMQSNRKAAELPHFSSELLQIKISSMI